MAKAPRRKCKVCNEWFHPAFSNQWWCSPEHGTQLALERRSKEREKAEKAAEKKRRREEQRQKDKLKIRKLALKPRSYWIKQAQQAVNAFIRERDRDLPCISCGTLTSAQWDAGHYRTTSINQAKQQRERDEAELRSVREMTEQHQKAMDYLHERERELVNLTAETQQPAIPEPLTYGASLDLNVSLLSALGQCNIDKASIKKIEESRTSL